MNSNWEEILTNFSTDMGKAALNIMMVIAVFIVAKLLHNALSKVTGKVIKNAGSADDARTKELITTMTLFRSVSRYVIYFIAVCICINLLGFGSVASNMVAAAGIGAIVISMGAQSIIGDMFGGLFIMFERQYTVGDFVRINNYEGTVTSLAMRCTYLVSRTGERIIVPNGEIRTVVNYTVKNSSAVVVVPTPYEEDTEKMIKIIRETVKEYANQHPESCYDEAVITGISAFNSSSVDITVRQPTKGAEYLKVERELRLAIKQRFDAEGISIPYTQLVIHEKSSES